MSAQFHTPLNTASAAMPKFTPAGRDLLQRKCACGGNPGLSGECEECRKKRGDMLQRSALGGGSSFSAPPIVHNVLNSPGQPLDAETRAFMEPRFGHDFSKVRVHTDTRAAESASTINALAYTVGHNIVFGSEQYAPRTKVGQNLIAHELTHTVQQGGGTTPARQQGSSSTGIPTAGLTILNSDQQEQAADAAASHIATGHSVRLSPGGAGIRLQCQPGRGKISRQEIEQCIRKWEKEPEEMSRLAADQFVTDEMGDSNLDLKWAPVQCETDDSCKVITENDGPVFDVTRNKETRRIGVGLNHAGGRRFCAYDYNGCERFNRRTPRGVLTLTLISCHGPKP